MGTESQMISGDTWLKSSEDKDLTVGADLKNGPAAVADIKILRAVKGNAGSDAHTLGIGRHGPIRSDAVYGSIKARGNVHLTAWIESDRGSVHQVCQKWLDVVVGVDLEDGDWNFLSSAPGKTNVDVPFSVQRGVGHGVQILGNWNSNFNLMRIAGVSIGRDHDGAGGCSRRYARDQEFVGT